MDEIELSETEKREICRGLLHLIQFDIYQTKKLINKQDIDGGISKLNDVHNLLEMANRLDYFPEDKIRFLSVRYNSIVLSPEVQKDPDRPRRFGLKTDSFREIFTDKELDLIGDELEQQAEVKGGIIQ